jgi:uncharacterized protein (DUF934 family)
MTALYKNDGFIADPWAFPDQETPIPANGPVALPRARLLAEWLTLQGRADGVGLFLEAGEKLEGLADFIPQLRLIALQIAKYSDGRHYSIARRLRDNFGYRGELRATGDVLRDQIPILRRAGFDALEITHPGTIQALRDGVVIAVQRHYQPASLEAVEAKPGWRPWLRVSPAS